ncbi:protein of unknown function (plasmid) [Cupriavidus taiwanensis]|uniref:Uncharacterized protein n=1 Tax=Cupriavidus taiwanensis TaxID=164546 RepID=A0A9Q7UXN0_9BURK|nr:protein of unknown function [Cupriavidus taiwanensis]
MIERMPWSGNAMAARGAPCYTESCEGKSTWINGLARRGVRIAVLSYGRLWQILSRGTRNAARNQSMVGDAANRARASVRPVRLPTPQSACA